MCFSIGLKESPDLANARVVANMLGKNILRKSSDSDFVQKM
jgi:hypothetical protein